MSHVKNQEYIDSKWDAFMWSLDKEDFELSQAIVNDLFDNGFDNEAVDFGKALLNKKMSVNSY